MKLIKRRVKKKSGNLNKEYEKNYFRFNDSIFWNRIFSKERCGTDEVNFSRIQNNPVLIETRKKQEFDLQNSILRYSKKRLNLTIKLHTLIKKSF